MHRSDALSFTQLLSYGLLTMPVAMAGLTLLTFLPTYYAVDLGLGLTVVGVVFAAGRVVDVLTDPVIGHLSDQTRTRFGPRKPWMAAGVVGFVLCFWLLVSPPGEVSLLYLILAGGGFFLFLTMLDVPYSAVGLELSTRVAERTRLASFKAAFQVSGALLAGSMPLLLGTTAPGALPVIGIVVCAFALAGFVAFAFMIPVPQAEIEVPRATIAQSVRALVDHRACRRLIGVFAVVQLGNAFFSALAVLFITNFLGQPEMVGALIALMFVSTALFLPVWQYLARRRGKLSAWRIAIATSCLALALTPFVTPGDLLLPAILFVIIGGTFGGDAILPTSMLADITHEQEVSGNRRQAGIFLAVKNASSKLSFVAPLAIAFPVLGWLNFENTANHDTLTLWLFLIFFGGFPIALKLCALALLKGETRFGAREAIDG